MRRGRSVDWVEVDGPAGSGQLMELLDRLIEPRRVRIQRSGRAELRHRGCAVSLRRIATCESIERYAARLEALYGRDEALRSGLAGFLDVTLDRGAWIHLNRDTIPDARLDYEESVVLLRDGGVVAPLRQIVRDLERELAEVRGLLELSDEIQRQLREARGE